MKSDATSLERFDGWFVRPLEKLHELPEGDGSYVALSIAFFLCERYYRTVTGTQDESGDGEAFKVAAAAGLGIKPDMFAIFWSVYRNGLQHQGMPRKHRDRRTGIMYYAELHEAFYGRPSFVAYDAATYAVRLSPWKFADIIIRKYRANPTVLEQAVVHALAVVYDTPV